MTIPSASLSAVAAAGLGCLVLFQIALALGAPFGRAAWGGRCAQLSTSQRVGSAISAGVLVVAAVVVLGRGVDLSALGIAESPRWGVWVVAAVLALSALANVASSSRWERFLMAPVAAVLALLTVLLA